MLLLKLHIFVRHLFLQKLFVQLNLLGVEDHELAGRAVMVDVGALEEIPLLVLLLPHLSPGALQRPDPPLSLSCPVILFDRHRLGQQNSTLLAIGLPGHLFVQ